MIRFHDFFFLSFFHICSVHLHTHFFRFFFHLNSVPVNTQRLSLHSSLFQYLITFPENKKKIQPEQTGFFFTLFHLFFFFLLHFLYSFTHILLIYSVYFLLQHSSTPLLFPLFTLLITTKLLEYNKKKNLMTYATYDLEKIICFFFLAFKSSKLRVLSFSCILLLLVLFSSWPLSLCMSEKV